MDTQPTPQNPGAPSESQPSVKPEDLKSEAAEQPKQTEAAPSPSPAPAAANQQTPAPLPQQPLTNDQVQAAIAAVPTTGQGSGGPAAAADVDVIEPEWVDKAEEVVRAHQGDPYGEEEAVEDLQKDYLNKRYGFNVADPKDNKPGGA